MLSCPPLPAPWHLLGGVIEWDALGWKDRLSVLRLGANRDRIHIAVEPPEILARLHAETVAALRSPEVADKLKLMAAEPKIMSAAEFGAFIASENQRITAIMRKADIKAQ